MAEIVVEPAPTDEISKKINAISQETVHHICSGQVVLDLAVAIKELVENSSDSGATTIDVKLVDYGKTCITVTDNGSGVAEQDFEGLGLKHHTSKIRDFCDLMDVSTFGFRGEALSSLCSLAEVSIITRHSAASHAYKLTFNHSGILQKKEVCARKIGTTVCIKNIFKTLPVRAKEFHKNIKREFAKAVQILYGYCLVSTGVKITCSNIVEGKSLNQLISTTGADSVMSNAASIYGKKSLINVTEVKLIPPDDETIQKEFNLSNPIIVDFTWEFFVSSCEHTYGRATPDRQFFFVNGRPCQLIKVSKLVNNIYHKFNNRQYPFVYLNLKLNQETADVNVTPDKRTIFLTQEKLVLATLKSSLMNKWEKMQGNFTANTVEQIQTTLKRSNTNKKNNGNSPPMKKQFISKSAAVDNEQSEELSEINSAVRKTKLKYTENCLDLIEKLPDAAMTISIESIIKEIELKKIKNDKNKEEKCKIIFRAEIVPTSNTDAEKELQKQLTKESFMQMQVLGQFNLGFIITLLDDDLFIVDQHASDEKFRFEKLNNEIKLKTQKLVVPKNLNLTAVNETIIIEHQEFFDANGFSLAINTEEQIGNRIQLMGMPVSGYWQFGQEDIEELIFLIKEGGSEGTNSTLTGQKILRPSRVRQMLASRACRSAVMIGEALNPTEMLRLVKQMGEMQNPWNCPHGRPTIRHLLSLKLLKKNT